MSTGCPTKTGKSNNTWLPATLSMVPYLRLSLLYEDTELNPNQVYRLQVLVAL